MTASTDYCRLDPNDKLQARRWPEGGWAWLVGVPERPFNLHIFSKSAADTICSAIFSCAEWLCEQKKDAQMHVAAAAVADAYNLGRHLL